MIAHSRSAALEEHDNVPAACRSSADQAPHGPELSGYIDDVIATQLEATAANVRAGVICR